jgi:hypothetical protein
MLQKKFYFILSFLHFRVEDPSPYEEDPRRMASSSSSPTSDLIITNLGQDGNAVFWQAIRIEHKGDTSQDGVDGADRKVR